MVWESKIGLKLDEGAGEPVSTRAGGLGRHSDRKEDVCRKRRTPENALRSRVL